MDAWTCRAFRRRRAAFPTRRSFRYRIISALPLSEANWLGTVYHGLPADLFRPSFEPGSYLAFLGRLTAEKGPEAAIRIARAAKMPLRIAAKVPRGERNYFKEKLEPQIDGEQVQLTGEVNDETKRQFLADAAALLFPIDWPEPFGLVMIEAMACGTPVIAFKSGSVPEVIDDGITGFVVPGEAEAAAGDRKTFRTRSAAGAQAVREKVYRQGEWRRSISVATRHWFIPVPAKFTPAPKNGPSAGGEPRPSSQRVPSGGPVRTHNPENCHCSR